MNTTPEHYPTDNHHSAKRESGDDLPGTVTSIGIVDEQGHAYAKRENVYNRVKNGIKRFAGRIDHGERWMILLTAIVALTTVSQAVQSCSNNRSTSVQVDRLIDAANRVDDAAESFSRSASGINGGVSDAVEKLRVQAEKMEAARKSSEQQATTALQATIDNFHQEQRAYLLPVDTNDKGGAYGLLKISLRNYGHVTAKNAKLEGTLDRFDVNAQPVIQESIPLRLPIATRVIPSDVPTFTWDVFTPNYGQRFPVTGDGLRLLGTITYDDGFGQRDSIGVCYAFQAARNQWELCGGDTSTYVQHLQTK